MSVESAEHPVQLGYSDRSADAWIGSVFDDAARKMRLPETCVQREPRRGAKLVLGIHTDEAAVGTRLHRRIQTRRASVVEDQPERLRILLRESVESSAQVVATGD